MRKVILLAIVTGLALVITLAIALSCGMRLGVPGEWEWQRLPLAVVPTGLDWTIGLAAVAGYAGVAGFGWRYLGQRPSKARELVAVAGLLAGSVSVQLLAHTAAPDGYGLAKWSIALHNSGSSGYYTVAKAQIADPWRFLRDYPAWISKQDALHIGTHPPGLFLVAFVMLREMEANPGAARFVVDHVPASVNRGFQVIANYQPLPRADRAALAITGALTLLACAATVLPLYFLVRASYPAQAAWAAAVLWPLVPSAILFQPTADTGFPLIATTALALAAQAGRLPSRRGLPLAFGAGATLALGMAFTLAFVAVGLVAALVFATSPGLSIRRKAFLIAATGAGFLLAVALAWVVTRANPFIIWWWNQRNHARFYVQYPRSYFAWALINPIELATALGLPASVWMAIGLGRPREAPTVTWCTLAVLAILTVSGRSLSEVARLWLPMMPALLAAAGDGIHRAGGGVRTMAATVFLMGVQTLILQAAVQVVYPV